MMLLRIIASFNDFVRRVIRKLIVLPLGKSRLGYCGKNVNYQNTRCAPNRVMKCVYLYDNVTLNSTSFIMNGGKFIMKKNSGSSSDLTVITGNHNRQLGFSMPEGRGKDYFDDEKDIIVDEDVWIGASVILCRGVHIGRGATIGAGTVVRCNIPPYSIVYGNPAKVVGFCFTPDEIIEHEKTLYPIEDRMKIEVLRKNYEKYFLKRVKEIKEFTRL